MTVSMGAPGSGEAAIWRGGWENWRGVVRSQLVWVWVIALAELAVYVAIDPSLFQQPQLVNFFLGLAPYVFTTFAQALVMLMAGVDLSIGATVSLVTAVLAVTGGLVGLALALACGVAIGVLNGVAVSVGRVPAIIVTLATSFMIFGTALLVLPTPGGTVPGVTITVGSATVGVPVAAWSCVVALIIWGWFKRTPLGRNLYAVGDSEEAARASGLAVTKVRIVGYVISGLFAAIAGIFLAVQIGSGDPTVGTPYTLSSIAGAVVGGVSFFGGRGTLRGALAGATIVGSLTSVLFFLGVSQFAEYIVEGGVLIGALVVVDLRSRKP